MEHAQVSVLVGRVRILQATDIYARTKGRERFCNSCTLLSCLNGIFSVCYNAHR